MTVPTRAVLTLLLLLSACARTPPPQAAQQPDTKPACQAGGNARGIAAGFFAVFQDRPDCF